MSASTLPSGVPPVATVLVVDNDPDLCRLLEMAFARGGAPVESTADADEAAERLAGGGIGALLLDLNLGAGLSGSELLLRWQARGILPPCWLVTGTPDDARLDAASAVAALQRVVAKPFPVLELVDEVLKMLQGGATAQEMSS